MANILTAIEAAVVLRCNENDANMLAILPGIDAYLKRATGKDWAKEVPIPDEAKNAARMLLVLWHENPGMISSETASPPFGLTACITQLAALALNTREIRGRNGAGACGLISALAGDTVWSVTGLVGVVGDQSAAFENVISVDGEIQQISSADLSKKIFRVKLTPPGDL